MIFFCFLFILFHCFIRQWTQHSLPITDVYVMEYLNVFRVFTCSSDFSVQFIDVYANKIILKISLHEPLEAITSNYNLNALVAGSMEGSLFFVDISLTRFPSSSSSQEMIVSEGERREPQQQPMMMSTINEENEQDGNNPRLPEGINRIKKAHSSRVTALAVLPDNITLVSTSSDGTLKMWNLLSRQLLKELVPFQRHSPISNCLVRRNDFIFVFSLSFHFISHLSHFLFRLFDNQN
jgi:WD40 repeat protein